MNPPDLAEARPAPRPDVRTSSSGTVISAKTATHTQRPFVIPLQMWRSQNINDLFVQAFAIQYSVTALRPDGRAARHDGSPARGGGGSGGPTRVHTDISSIYVVSKLNIRGRLQLLKQNWFGVCSSFALKVCTFYSG